MLFMLNLYLQVSPEDIAPYDPKYDSVGPATNNNNTTTPSSAAAAVNTTIQESSADGREAEHDQPKLELDRPDRGELVTDASDRDHPCIEAEEVSSVLMLRVIIAGFMCHTHVARTHMHTDYSARTWSLHWRAICSGG